VRDRLEVGIKELGGKDFSFLLLILHALRK